MINKSIDYGSKKNLLADKTRYDYIKPLSFKGGGGGVGAGGGRGGMRRKMRIVR